MGRSFFLNKDTSGGPIVDDDGKILAVVSIARGSVGVTTLPPSIPSLWLPSWLLASVPGEE